MIRRVISILSFAFGGWMLTCEAMLAFFTFDGGAAAVALGIGFFLIIAGVPLLIGSWISPGRRWRELGITLLVVAAVALFLGVTMGLMLVDPAMKGLMPPLPEGLSIAPLKGAANLLAIAGLGWWLYRGSSRAGEEARDRSQEGS
ncbi:hypothetical protein G7078_10610 [Sphingomonas sinipercae]|uniref:Uncharacterized protein n=1 Tax=Sphingomonas sinipercae TaxID=2714944 RepID=A0A6G7ZQC3_9SPHN|nr:hypothetical protein [Sphingomonas sinipercae]QIL03184.1 hypothetical protein G7078_10610 [Sphingomonas sinipercae]